MSSASDQQSAQAIPSHDELQGRLAKRLKQVDAGERALSAWMGVRIGERALLIPLSHASEIVPWQKPTPVPYTKPWFMGIVGWRGELSGVVDLACFLDAGHAKQRVDAQTSSFRLLTLNPALEINVALLIDQVAGLKSVAEFVQAHRPADDNPWPFLGNLYTDQQGTTWQELNLQSLSTQESFLSIGI
ncbi:chemotaxis protein CheW [Lampropedia puyangensis]|uniref:Chemotaxis protein CheW n=1 Tax=Lampropedia puyangensis TaxID=1330072 RepID=A0A4S8EYM4_9BURK|nr:chemotaxis protein CheW [Lampropedia puyangensis]THT98773.1 chemotaxis protein CheW [Lampropedia puyangensis]